MKTLTDTEKARIFDNLLSVLTPETLATIIAEVAQGAEVGEMNTIRDMTGQVLVEVLSANVGISLAMQMVGTALGELA